MSSSMDDQQLSPMQSTSEFGESKKELRQKLECCEKEETNRNLSSDSYNLTLSNYKSVFEKLEPHVSQYDDISYNLNKKIEREGICHLSEINFLPAKNLIFHTGRRVERLYLSKILDVPSSFGQVDKLTTSKKSCDEYEMMLPTTVTPRLLSKEQAFWTAEHLVPWNYHHR
ncbi:unnamed protein product [Brugia pahangi]|uniref:DDE_Tnp_1_7 domain-containing protein n=1 Tax=Brugia pahangi TaxID=6280 RepID=A0A0N4T2H5_BRUPA|nr:unnamed protein product [Brugia pahangi]